MLSSGETYEEYHRRKSQEHYQRHKTKYKERYTKTRQQYRQILNDFKINGCIVCGETHLKSLDFHHVNGMEDKEQDVGQMIGYNMERFLLEISKCVVLCKNCHCKIHDNVFSIWPPPNIPKIDKCKQRSNTLKGTCWVKNNTESIRINKTELKHYISMGWEKGRKIKYNSPP